MSDFTISPAALVVIAPMVAGLFWLLMGAKDKHYEAVVKSKDDQILELNYRIDALTGIAKSSTSASEIATNRLRAREGKPPLHRIADVVPEHSSPVTPKQEAAGELATLRARVAAVATELDLPLRTIGTHEEKSGGTREAEAAIVEGPRSTKSDIRITGKMIEEIAEIKETGEDTNRIVKEVADTVPEKKPDA